MKPFLLPALSGCVLLGAERWLAALGEAVGPQGDDAVTGDVAGGAEAVLGQVGAIIPGRWRPRRSRAWKVSRPSADMTPPPGAPGAAIMMTPASMMKGTMVPARNGQVFGEEHDRRGAGHQVMVEPHRWMVAHRAR